MDHRRRSAKPNVAAIRNYSFTEMSLRNTEVVRAMGMTEGLLKRWAKDRNLCSSVRSLPAIARPRCKASFDFPASVVGNPALGAYLYRARHDDRGDVCGKHPSRAALQPVEQMWDPARSHFAGGAFKRVRSSPPVRRMIAVWRCGRPVAFGRGPDLHIPSQRSCAVCRSTSRRAKCCVIGPRAPAINVGAPRSARYGLLRGGAP